jgi:hypothetical protein
MNLLPLDMVQTIRRLAKAGYSKRATARTVGVSTNTIRHYWPSGALCGCGRDSGHNGWCKWRYLRSNKRREYHRLRRCTTIAQREARL